MCIVLNKITAFLIVVILGSAANAIADTNLLNNLSIPNGCVIANIGITSGQVVLEPTWSVNTYVCQPGYYLPADGEACVRCPNNNYCTGGAWTFNTQNAQGITECPNSWYAPTGMSELGSCGRILHVGNNVIYLRSEKKTFPSLNVKIGDDIFYANMTVADINMNEETDRKLKIGYENATFSVYDDSVDVSSE